MGRSGSAGRVSPVIRRPAGPGPRARWSGGTRGGLAYPASRSVPPTGPPEGPGPPAAEGGRRRSGEAAAGEDGSARRGSLSGPPVTR